MDKQVLALLDAAIERHKGALYKAAEASTHDLQEAVAALVLDDCEHSDLLNDYFKRPADDVDRWALAGVLIVQLLSNQRTNKENKNG